MKKINKKVKRKLKTKKSSNNNLLTWIPVITPFVSLLLYISLAIHCRLAVGYWPRAVIENVNMKSYEIHERAFWLFTYVVLASLPCWLVMLFFKKFRINIKIHLMQFIVFGLGILLIILTLMFDPTPFTEWFLD